MKTTISINYPKGSDNFLKVTGDLTAYVPGNMYDSNGDPGSPPEEADFQITEIQYKRISIYELMVDLNLIDEIKEQLLSEIE